MPTTRVTAHVPASPTRVYAALVDPAAVQRWRVPDGMHAEILEYDARVRGRFRVSLTYDDPAAAGKTSGATDTYAGHFAELVPGERVVEVLAFETDDPALATEMTMTTTLTPVGDGTEVELTHEGVPDRVPPEDNELGTRMALARLAAYVSEPVERWHLGLTRSGHLASPC